MRTKVFVVVGLVALMTARPLQHFHFFPHKKGLTPLFIYTGSKILKFQVEVADTNEKRMTGLMYRRSLGANEGMLFVFNEEGPRSFWMKNTYLSLDMLFINAHQEVVFMDSNTPPLSEESISSPLSAQYVLEVNAGTAVKNDIRVGSRVSF